jgi:hypothetical protein
MPTVTAIVQVQEINIKILDTYAFEANLLFLPSEAMKAVSSI